MGLDNFWILAWDSQEEKRSSEYRSSGVQNFPTQSWVGVGSAEIRATPDFWTTYLFKNLNGCRSTKGKFLSNYWTYSRIRFCASGRRLEDLSNLTLINSAQWLWVSLDSHSQAFSSREVMFLWSTWSIPVSILGNSDELILWFGSMKFVSKITQTRDVKQMEQWCCTSVNMD